MKQLEAGYLTESFSRAKSIAPAPVADLDQRSEGRTADRKSAHTQTRTV